MKLFVYKIKILFLIFLILNFFKLKAEDFNLRNTSNQSNQILIESNKQRSDLKNSIFYAEGDVIITNIDKEFIAKSNKAVFYKSTGIIELIGNVEVNTNDSSKIKAGEVIYYLNDNQFEANSNLNQRVNTEFVFGQK